MNVDHKYQMHNHIEFELITQKQFTRLAVLVLFNMVIPLQINFFGFKSVENINEIVVTFV